MLTANKTAWLFDDNYPIKAIFRKYLKKKCWPEYNPQFSFKYFKNLGLIQMLFSKVSKVQKTFVK